VNLSGHGTSLGTVSEPLGVRDADLRTCAALVEGARGETVRPDRTAFSPTGAGQPDDTGSRSGSRVGAVGKEKAVVRHARTDG